MHPIAQKIAALQRRLTYRGFATAACWTAATVLAAAIALGLADYLVRFRDPGLRIMATAALTAVVLFAVYRWWYVPRHKRLNPLTVARRVESHFPQLNDSLASALEFLQQSEDDQTAGSSQLRRIVVAETETSVAGLPLEEVIDRRPLRRALAWLIAVVIVLAICLAWDAGAVRTALARLAAPLGKTQWLRQHHLEFRDPPLRLAAGQTFEAELFDTAGNLPDDVRITYRLTNGTRRETISEPMVRVGDVMIARRENVRESFAFRATGGDDDLMGWQRVDVVEPPQLKSLTVTVHPTAYTGLPSSQAQRHLDVLAATRIELRGTATEALSAARILRDGQEPIIATISQDDTGITNVFHIAPNNWIATQSGPYRLELSDTEDLAGVVGQWNLRVESDSPPSVTWQLPSEDLYVVQNAVVPIDLVVKDNLAIAKVELAYERSDWSEAERERVAPTARLGLYRGPEKVTVPSASTDQSVRGESRIVKYAWDLAPLEITIGAELTIAAEAADYRPGVGKTVSPRRITILTPDELDARFAERLAQIGRQLERALGVERTTREDVRRLEIQQSSSASFDKRGRNVLQSAELNQRRVSRILIDPSEGVPALVEVLVRDMEINRITQSDVRVSIDQLSDELKLLASGPLSAADRDLTESRKSIGEAVHAAAVEEDDKSLPLPPEQAANLLRLLTSAGAAQDEVIATLERLIGDLSSKSDFGRFARQIAELREDQLAHERSTRADIGVETLPLRPNELTRAQLTTLNSAAAGQSAIAVRFAKIEQGMDSLAQEMSQAETDGADTLAEAVELARSLAIGSKMSESAREIVENRIGGALERELQIGDDLQQVLNVLRETTERKPEQVVDKLKEAEEQLDVLRKQLADLRQQIVNVEQQPANASNQQQLDALNTKQQELRREIGKLARQLDQLQAADASQSTQNAANRLGNRPVNENQPPQQQPRPSPSNQVQKAEEDLAQAAEQLADRRQQAEDDLALEFVRRFQAALTEMVDRQKKAIEQTANLHDGRHPKGPLSQSEEGRVVKLAEEERELAQIAKDHSEVLHGLGAVRVSLEEAERRLLSAATLLDARDTGPDAQQAERHALARLESMMDTFAQTANEAQQDEQPPPNAGAGPNGDQPQRRPTFELLEIKMLRLLQTDLQARTRDYQQRIAGQNQPPAEDQRAKFQQEAQELAAEQGRLAELVEDMLARNNEGEQ